MPEEKPTVASVFCAAIEIESAEERREYVVKACGEDAEFFRQVDRLLQAHYGAGSFLESPAEGFGTSPTIDQPIAEKPGTQIGPYKLLQQIGEGGMGVVYMAEQTEPVRRRVALKVIKPGMDTRQVIARFEAERQALALMDHPNIARVLDAGTTDTGRPYFVMELVKGMPITQYCDEQHLTPRERLELFLPICQAVQHAHQKGVIHRDLKPSNILVACYDDKAVPKIIDFGVAKAVSQRLTEKTMFTQYGQLVGTIEYMSPEQAQFNQLDVDTRSDIYSLGVLLYELLTGETPFDKQRLRSAAFEELLRIIREEEPPRPSAKLSTSATLPSVAANRKIEPHRLSTLVRGELDWIVMKAMEKDRCRRYETASAFAADVLHYLNDEAVVACPPSAGYRFRKFVRRNSAAIGTTAAIAACLIVLAVGSTMAAIRFERLASENARLVDQKSDLANDLQSALNDVEANLALARQQEQQAKDNLTLATTEQERAERNLQLAIEAFDTVFLDFISERRLRQTISESAEPQMLTPSERELLDTGVAFYEKLIDTNEDSDEAVFASGSARIRTGMLQGVIGNLTEARRQFDLAIESLELLISRSPRNAAYHRELARAYSNWALNSERPAQEQMAFSLSVSSYTDSLQIDDQSADMYSERATALRWLNRHKEALEDDLRAQQLDQEDPSRLVALAWRILWIESQAPELYDLPRALKYAREAVSIDPDNSRNLAVFAQCLLRDGRIDEAVAEIDKAVALDPNLVFARIQRIDVYREKGDLHAALADANRAVELEPTPYAYRLRASVFRDLKRYDEALADFEKIDEEEVRGDFYYWIKRGEIHALRGEHEKTIEYLSRGFELTPRGYWYLRKRRAVAFFSLGKYSEAIADLDTARKQRPIDLSTLIWVGTANIAACPDEDFKEGIIALADEAIAHPDTDKPLAHRYRAELLDAMGRPEALDDYTWLIENQPEQPMWLLRRGLIRREAADDAGAREDFEAANSVAESLDAKPLGWHDEYQLALLSLESDRPAVYRDACLRMLRGGAETTNAVEANFIAWTAALAPDAVEDYAPLLSLANKALASDPGNQQYANTLGAILYRAAQSEEARVRLTELAEQIDNPAAKANTSPAYCWYFLAMTHHALSQADEAREWLAKANAWTEHVLTDESNPPAWNRRLTLELLRDEANVMIDAEEAPHVPDQNRASDLAPQL